MPILDSLLVQLLAFLVLCWIITLTDEGVDYVWSCLRALRRPSWRWWPLLALVVLTVLDGLTTSLALSHPSVFEANPFQAPVVNQYGAWVGMLTALPLRIGIGVLLIGDYRLLRTKGIAAAGFLIFMVLLAALTAVVINNYSIYANLPAS